MVLAEVIVALGVLPLILGITVATISAAFAVKWLVGYLANHGLAIFGWYRIILAIRLAGLWIGGVVQFGPDDASVEEPGSIAPLSTVTSD